MFKTAIKSLTVIAMSATPLIADAATYDDFSTSLKWDAFSYGKGKATPYTIQTAGKLEIDIPPNSTGTSFGAGYTSFCKFHGDFDIQVDYALSSFPEANGVRVGLIAGNVISKAKWGSGAEIARISWADSEGHPSTDAYVTHINYDCCYDVPTSDRIGKLRVIRKANVLSGYYFDNLTQKWSLISSNIVKLGDTAIEIGAWSHDSTFSDQPIKIFFDNVVVNKGSLIGTSCPAN